MVRRQHLVRACAYEMSTPATAKCPSARKTGSKFMVAQDWGLEGNGQ
jgi:hypothetical protein